MRHSSFVRQFSFVKHPTSICVFDYRFFALRLFSLMFMTVACLVFTGLQAKAHVLEHVQEVEQRPGSAAAGRMIADQLCSSCHSIEMQGDSPFKPAPPFRDVVGKYPVDSLAEALAEGIVVGHEAMPEFQFGPEILSDFLAFLDTFKTE